MVLALAGQRGEPGKTTTTVNLAGALAASGMDILVVDLDPRARVGAALGVVPQEPRSVGFALQARLDGVPSVLSRMFHPRDELLAACANAGKLDVFAAVPGALHKAERAIAAADFEGTVILRDLLRAVRGGYHVIVVDTPPSTSALSAVALAAADFVIAVATPSHASLPGAAMIKAHTEVTTERTASRSCPRFLGTVLNKVRASRERTLQDVSVEARFRQLGLRTFATQIPDDERIKRALDLGRPVCASHPLEPPSVAYRNLAWEVVERAEQMDA